MSSVVVFIMAGLVFVVVVVVSVPVSESHRSKLHLESICSCIIISCRPIGLIEPKKKGGLCREAHQFCSNFNYYTKCERRGRRRWSSSSLVVVVGQPTRKEVNFGLSLNVVFQIGNVKLSFQSK